MLWGYAKRVRDPRWASRLAAEVAPFDSGHPDYISCSGCPEHQRIQLRLGGGGALVLGDPEHLPVGRGAPEAAPERCGPSD